MTGPVVDIVIVNWNSGDLLQACLRSLAEGDVSPIASVVVVDNASSDGSADVKQDDLPLTVVKAHQNLGFGKACNLGARRGQAPLILFLNPDTEVFAGTVALTVDYLQDPGNAEVGVAGIRLVGRDGMAQRHCARFPGLRSMIAETTGLSAIMPKAFPSVHMREFDHCHTRDVDHVIGAYYCVRREIFERVGGFDAAFFVYFEDLDLSRRIASLGMRIRYLAEISAYHRQGGTSDQIRARRLTYVLQARSLYAAKHLPWPKAFAAGLLTWTVEPVARTAKALARGSIAETRATWHGFAMFYASQLARWVSPRRNEDHDG